MKSSTSAKVFLMKHLTRSKILKSWSSRSRGRIMLTVRDWSLLSLVLNTVLVTECHILLLFFYFRQSSESSNWHFIYYIDRLYHVITEICLCSFYCAVCKRRTGLLCQDQDQGPYCRRLSVKSILKNNDVIVRLCWLHSCGKRGR